MPASLEKGRPVPMFPESFIQQVAQATDIVDLVGQYVALNKRGKELLGLCPFHNDKNPSMNVSPVKQIFKCFACGAGGGVFQFVMMYEKLTFPEAVRTLAERANIPLPAVAASPLPRPEDGLSKSELLKVTAFAAEFFAGQLRSAAGREALDYARRRGLSDESIDRFGLGWAPDSWDALLKAAQARRIGPNALVAAGLAVRREDTPGRYDRFRNRWMFPIFDPAGSVVAFGGRAMAENERAKYINSPESPLYDKSALLYGLNWAREAIRRTNQAVVVEGYLDVLIPQQAGVDNVVATCGTSLTERHVRLLGRCAGEAVLVFDADAAGANAAQRALEVFLAQRIHVRVATIPAGKDPCDFCLAEGPDALRALVAEAPDALQYVWQRRQAELSAAGENLADRRRIVEDFLGLVASSAAYGAIDEIRKGQLAQHIAHMLNVPAAGLHQTMRRLARRIRPSGGPARAVAAEPAAMSERHVLEVLVNEPELFDLAAERIGPEDFADSALQAVAHRVWEMAHEGTFTLDQLIACEQMAPQAALLAELACAGEARGNYEQTLGGAVEHLIYRREGRRAEQLKAAGTDESLAEFTRRQKTADQRRFPTGR